MLVTLKSILQQAKENHYAIAGFNVYGFEDAMSIVNVAERLKQPVILMTNVDAIEHMPIHILGRMLTQIAEDAKVPVCVHLDHGKSLDTIEKALKAGYSSVMFDGSQLPLDENIQLTKKVVDLAKAYKASVEGEIGSVGYTDPTIQAKASYTSPEEAEKFVLETGVDAVAVAIGTLHRMEAKEAHIQYDLLKAIEAKVHKPLVLHGSSGVKDDDLKKLRQTGISKVNIGTAVRMAFGHAMRNILCQNHNLFDRVTVFQGAMIEVEKVVEEKMKLLGGQNV